MPPKAYPQPQSLTVIPDVARRLRIAYKKQLAAAPRFLDERQLQTGYDLIGVCPDPSAGICINTPCVPSYLDNAYDPFETQYPSGSGYSAASASLELTSSLWSGTSSDRTETDGYSLNLVLSFMANIVKEISQATCDAVDHDLKVCIFCVVFELPSPAKIVCEVIGAVFQLLFVIRDSLKTQMDFQDDLVQGAEIEASYE